MKLQRLTTMTRLLGVTEFGQERRASEEVRELWRQVLKKLVEGSLDHEPHAKKAAC